MSVQIRRLPAPEAAPVISSLFAIFHGNMKDIDPWEESRWCAVIQGALEDPRRAMLIVREGDEIVGFFMYACNGETFLMEEIQLIPRIQGTGVFRAIYAEVLPRLPQTVTAVEAYAHKSNLRSQGILSHLGLSVIGENKNGNSYHYRGDFRAFLEKFNQ